MGTLLQELVTYLKEVSPMLWETLMRQVYMNAVATSAWAVAMLVLAGISLYVCRKAYKKTSAENREWSSSVIDEMSVIFGAVGFVTGVIVFMICITMAIPMFLNPQYYAIQLILENLH